MKRWQAMMAALVLALGCETEPASSSGGAGDSTSTADTSATDTTTADTVTGDGSTTDTVAGDALGDSQADAVSDAASDSQADTGADTQSDATGDSLADTLGDTQSDTQGDTAGDTSGPDASKDIQPDTAGGCCNLGGQGCPAGTQCVENKECLPPAKAGACWTKEDCGGLACLDAFVCPCDADCGIATHQGVCATSETCCGGPCGKGESCVGGVCKGSGNLMAGQCWSDLDCTGGAACKGANICPCGAMCLVADKPGTCDAADPLCCSGGTCGTGKVCVADKNMCKALAELQPGQCWTEAECAKGEICAAASVCPCGAMCLVADKAGTCKAKSCATIAPGALGMCEMVVGWGFDGKSCVMMSGCGCGSYCANIFADQASCQAACP